MPSKEQGGNGDRGRKTQTAKKTERERERETVELSNLGVPKAYTAKGTKP